MDVADELLDIDQTVDRSYVERRIDDWLRRLARLYADIEAWLPERWSMADGGGVQLHEELMEKFDVPAQTLPIKTLLFDQISKGRLEPRGLWIVGANGRVDLIMPPAHYLIVDRSQSFERPQWKIIPLRDRLNGRALTEEVFRASLD